MIKDKTAIQLVIHKYISEKGLSEIINRLTITVNKVEILYDNNNNDRIRDDAIPIIHYGLNYVYPMHKYNEFFIESSSDISTEIIKSISTIILLKKKNILLYLGKFPKDSIDIDGGSQLARQLIDTFKTRCNLDLVFIRKYREVHKDTKVSSISYVEYLNPLDNKFSRRLDNPKTNIEAIIAFKEHHLIIAGHCSKLFGISDKKQLMKKAIIFPMMLTGGYQRSNEIVPKEYTKQEELVLRNVFKIITPSEDEKKDILNDYRGVSESKIKVIPRGINPFIVSRVHKLDDSRVRFITIGSIKKQKNHIDVLKFILNLKNKGYMISLAIVGSIHDKEVYGDLNEYIRGNNLFNNVSFHSELDPKALAKLINQMDFSISCSRWETFGRGIFEGFAAGLPSLISNALTAVSAYAEGYKGAIFCSSVEEMTQEAKKLINNKATYEEASTSVLNIGKLFSYSVERERLFNEIICKKFNIITPFIDWDTDSLEPIYKGKYSSLYKYNKQIRKYFNYNNKQKFIGEFKQWKAAFHQNIPTPKPLFFTYDIFNGKWYIASEYINKIPHPPRFNISVYIKLHKIVSRFYNIINSNERMNYWGKVLLPEFKTAIKKYNIKHKDDIDISYFDNLSVTTFIHGDLLIKNIGLSRDSGNIILFDFQNSCQGPKNWDKCYYLSQFNRKNILINIHKIDEIMILYIIKMRIGRAIIKKRDTSELIAILKSWKDS